MLHCVRNHTTLPALSTADYRAFSTLFDDGVHGVLQPRQIVARRDNPGATAPRRVRQALVQARRRLARSAPRKGH